jgi:hypothetical protein
VRSKLAFGIVLLPHLLFAAAVLAWSKPAAEDDRLALAFWAAQGSIVLLPLALRPLRPWRLFALGAAAVVVEYIVALATHEGCLPDASPLSKCEDFSPAFFTIGMFVVPLASAFAVAIGQLVARVGDLHAVQPLARRGLGAAHYRALIASWLVLAAAGGAGVLWLAIRSARPCDGSLVVTRAYGEASPEGLRSLLASEPPTDWADELASRSHVFTPLGELLVHRRATRRWLVNRQVSVTLPRSCDGRELDVVGPPSDHLKLELDHSSGDYVLAEATYPSDFPHHRLAFRRMAPGPSRALERFAAGFAAVLAALAILAFARRRLLWAGEYFAKRSLEASFRAPAAGEADDRKGLHIARSKDLWAAAAWLAAAAALLAWCFAGASF